MTSIIADNSLNLTLVKTTVGPNDPLSTYPLRLPCVVCVGKKRGPRKTYHNMLSLCYHFRTDHQDDIKDKMICAEFVNNTYSKIKEGSI